MRIHHIEGVTPHGEFIAESSPMREALHALERAAHSPLPVCIHGPVGSPLVRAARHMRGARSQAPSVMASCGELASQLDALLYGAQSTLRTSPETMIVLHGIAHMARADMVRLDATLAQMEARPVRLVTTTHHDLERLVAQGAFDEVLRLRLQGICVWLPALSERRDDIIPLTHQLIAELRALAPGARKLGAMTEGVRARLLTYAWPGDEQELRNVVGYALMMGDGELWSEDELPETMRATRAVEDEASPKHGARDEEPEDGPGVTALIEALERASGNRTRAAKLLGISRTTLWRKLRAHGLL